MYHNIWLVSTLRSAGHADDRMKAGGSALAMRNHEISGEGRETTRSGFRVVMPRDFGRDARRL